MDCAYTLEDRTEPMDLAEAIEFLEAAPERPDPENPGDTLPARGGAVCLSAADFAKLKTAIEQACSQLATVCTPEVRQMLRRVERLLRAKP